MEEEEEEDEDEELAVNFTTAGLWWIARCGLVEFPRWVTALVWYGTVWSGPVSSRVQFRHLQLQPRVVPEA